MGAAGIESDTSPSSAARVQILKFMSFLSDFAINVFSAALFSMGGLLEVLLVVSAPVYPLSVRGSGLRDVLEYLNPAAIHFSGIDLVFGIDIQSRYQGELAGIAA
jgi:hypothetical protein